MLNVLWFSTSTLPWRSSSTPRGAGSGSARRWLFSAISRNFSCWATWKNQKATASTREHHGDDVLQRRRAGASGCGDRPASSRVCGIRSACSCGASGSSSSSRTTAATAVAFRRLHSTTAHYRRPHVPARPQRIAPGAAAHQPGGVRRCGRPTARPVRSAPPAPARPTYDSRSGRPIMAYSPSNTPRAPASRTRT